MSGLTRASGSGGGSSTPSNVLIRTFIAGVVVGDSVYQTVAGPVDKASAVSIATTPVLGIVSQINTPVLGSCYVQYSGDISGFVGLTAGEVYMLSKDPGKLLWESDTGNPNYPSSSGNVVQAVGIARSATTLQIAIQDQVEL